MYGRVSKWMETHSTSHRQVQHVKVHEMTRLLVDCGIYMKNEERSMFKKQQCVPDFIGLDDGER